MEAEMIGARVARLRAARGLSGEQLGKALGLTKSQISKIESGARRVDVSELAEMADVLGVTLGELLGTPRSRSLALAARVMAMPATGSDLTARRRLRQLLEAESVLGRTSALPPLRPSEAGERIFELIEAENLSGSRRSAAAGERLAELVRDALGLGRSPVADIAELAERHLAVDVALWPMGQTVSGLCAHGDGVGVLLVDSDFSAGHERFTTAHELAHHLLSDPREIVIEDEPYEMSTPAELRANAFAAAFLMPEAGIREMAERRPIDATALGELLRHFRVSYRALVHRLKTLRMITHDETQSWLNQTATGVLLAAGDSRPTELTEPTHARRIPTRLWRTALLAYQAGQVGSGVLAGLADTDAEAIYAQLDAAGIRPPLVVDDLADV